NVLLPALDEWREFKSYPATSRLDAGDVLSMAGNKFFEQVIVPQNADLKQIPALNFSFFDPEQKAYRTLTQPAIPLKVSPHLGGAQQPTILTNIQKTAPTQTELVHIKTYPGSLSVVSPPLLQRPSFLMLQIVP